MRTFLLATAALAITCDSAFAQSAATGERTNRAGMSGPMNSNDKMMMRHHRKHHMMKKKMMNDGMGNGMMKNDGMMNKKM